MIRERRLPILGPMLALAGVLGASAAHAATQGSLSSMSTGSIGISVSVAPRATISGERDIDLGGSGTVRNRAVQILCLSSNSTMRTYSVAAAGGSDAGIFELSSGDRTIGYTVKWAASQAAPPETNEASGTLLEAASWQAECEPGTSSTAFVVAIDDEDLDEVRAGGAFTGSLTLLISPH